MVPDWGDIVDNAATGYPLIIMAWDRNSEAADWNNVPGSVDRVLLKTTAAVQPTTVHVFTVLRGDICPRVRSGSARYAGV